MCLSVNSVFLHTCMQVCVQGIRRSEHPRDRRPRASALGPACRPNLKAPRSGAEQPVHRSRPARARRPLHRGHVEVPPGAGADRAARGPVHPDRVLRPGGQAEILPDRGDRSGQGGPRLSAAGVGRTGAHPRGTAAGRHCAELCEQAAHPRHLPILHRRSRRRRRRRRFLALRQDRSSLGPYCRPGRDRRDRPDLSPRILPPPGGVRPRRQVCGRASGYIWRCSCLYVLCSA